MGAVVICVLPEEQQERFVSVKAERPLPSITLSSDTVTPPPHRADPRPHGLTPAKNALGQRGLHGHMFAVAYY